MGRGLVRSGMGAMAILLVDEQQNQLVNHRLYGEIIRKEHIEGFNNFTIPLNSQDSVNSYVVLNNLRMRVYRVFRPSTVSAFGWWSCGLPEAPAAHAVFGDDGGATRCTKCFCG